MKLYDAMVEIETKLKELIPTTLHRVVLKKHLQVEGDGKKIRFANYNFMRDKKVVNIISGDNINIDYHHAHSIYRTNEIICRFFFIDISDSVNIEKQLNDSIEIIYKKVLENPVLPNASGIATCVNIKYVGDNRTKGVFNNFEIVDMKFEIILQDNV